MMFVTRLLLSTKLRRIKASTSKLRMLRRSLPLSTSTSAVILAITSRRTSSSAAPANLLLTHLVTSSSLGSTVLGVQDEEKLRVKASSVTSLLIPILHLLLHSH